MKFYTDWKNCLFDIEKNKNYTKKFLSKAPESLEVFMNGTNEELIEVSKFLLQIPINNFIYCINEDKKCTTDMIVQYSNLEHALIDVSRVLKYNTSSLTFSQLGRILRKAKEEGACKKYGENHAKLAYEFSMVSLERKGAIEVKNTSFGNFSVELSNDDRIELAKRLVIRNEFLQKLIYLAKKGDVEYMEIACETLSKSTALRRKSNNRQLINLVLKDNKLINNIVW